MTDKKPMIVKILIAILIMVALVYFVMVKTTPTTSTNTTMNAGSSSGSFVTSYLKNYQTQNHLDNFDFILQKEFENAKYAKFAILPRKGDFDEAQIYIMKGPDGKWVVIAGPATSFPGLEDAYPELKSLVQMATTTK